MVLPIAIVRSILIRTFSANCRITVSCECTHNSEGPLHRRSNQRVHSANAILVLPDVAKSSKPPEQRRNAER